MDTRVAIITGAGRGIGRAIAVELAKCGWRLVLSARTQNELDETAELAGGGMVIAGDICDSIYVERLVVEAMSAFGRIDCLINNAGYAPALKMEQIDPAEWDKILAVNLSAPFHLCRRIWPVFVKQQGGVLVNISSFSSRDPFPGLGFYGAAKAGLNLLGLELARQGAPHNIRVHTLALAAVETAMFRQLMTVEQVPVNQTLTSAEVAGAVRDCIDGPLRHTSGEVVYLRKT